jgi:HD-GYP domain-containing protein (c-di-GMP phosphodiesterase class II)
MPERSENPRADEQLAPDADPEALLTRPAKDRTQKLGRSLVTHFYMLAKTVGMFDFTNVITREAMATFLETLKRCHQEENVVILQLASECLFVNETRLKIDFEAFASFKFVLEAMKERDVGGLAFRDDVTEQDLEAFLQLFGENDQRAEDARERIQAGLQAAGVDSIWLEEQKELADRRTTTDVTEDYREVSINTYFKSIFVAKQFMENIRGARATYFQKARRLVHSVVDVVGEDDSTLLALTQIKNFDDFLFTHSANVCVLAVAVGQQIGLGKQMLGCLGLAALLHDVGMTEMPRGLGHGDSLRPHEQELYEKHPAAGARLLLRSQGVSEVSIRCILVSFEHHLNEDFSGFPALNRPRSLSLLGRIVALVDFYDKVTTPGPGGKPTLSSEDALRLMADEGRALFDPLLVKVVANVLGSYPLGTVVRLDTGEIGIVFRRGTQLARPMVKVISDELGMPVEPRIVDLGEKDRNEFARTVTETMPPTQYFETAQDYAESL